MSISIIIGSADQYCTAYFSYNMHSLAECTDPIGGPLCKVSYYFEMEHVADLQRALSSRRRGSRGHFNVTFDPLAMKLRLRTGC